MIEDHFNDFNFENDVLEPKEQFLENEFNYNPNFDNFGEFNNLEGTDQIEQNVDSNLKEKMWCLLQGGIKADKALGNLFLSNQVITSDFLNHFDIKLILNCNYTESNYEKDITICCKNVNLTQTVGLDLINLLNQLNKLIEMTIISGHSVLIQSKELEQCSTLSISFLMSNLFINFSECIHRISQIGLNLKIDPLSHHQLIQYEQYLKKSLYDSNQSKRKNFKRTISHIPKKPRTKSQPYFSKSMMAEDSFSSEKMFIERAYELPLDLNHSTNLLKNPIRATTLINKSNKSSISRSITSKYDGEIYFDPKLNFKQHEQHEQHEQEGPDLSFDIKNELSLSKNSEDLNVLSDDIFDNCEGIGSFISD